MIAPHSLPALSAAELHRYATRGSDLARLTARPALEQPPTLGAGAQHAGQDGGEQLGFGAGAVGAGVGVGHALNVERRGSEEES